MILTAKAAENQYVGVSCGKLDQSCEVLSKKNHLLYLDTKDDSFELIPTSKEMKPYKVGIFFSGLERSLQNSKYNLRQDECKAAAYALMGYAGMDYGSFADTKLRDVPYEIMTTTDGIYGGRFSGAGFKGCCMALIDPDKAEEIEAKVTAEYLRAFPALKGKYSFHLCESADGVEL
mgnify:CR=1 FL=1